jgi:hypothetical protein
LCVCCVRRDLRDAALDDASRAKSELRQLRAQHEELLLSSREAASRADVANSQLLGELKLKGFELTRLQVGGTGVRPPGAHRMRSSPVNASWRRTRALGCNVQGSSTGCVLTAAAAIDAVQ